MTSRGGGGEEEAAAAGGRENLSQVARRLLRGASSRSEDGAEPFVASRLLSQRRLTGRGAGRAPRVKERF